MSRLKRIAIKELIEWKNRKQKKPLIINGARQVGKTWLMKEFARSAYPKNAYFNFDRNPLLSKIFESDLEPQKIIQSLKLESGINIEPENTLIIFDEIQECPKALNSLKYFCEEAQNYHIICAGSLLGLYSHSGNSFPVGKVEYLNLYPLSFEEYLIAIGEEQLQTIIRNNEEELLKIFHNKIINYLKEYYYIGGMPEVVSNYIENKDYNQVRTIQERILRDYRNDFSKHAPTELISKIELVWDNISTQLSKENKKFIYGVLKTGARAKDYEDAIWWLQGAGLIYKVYRVKNSKVPLSSYKDYNAFKLYMFDTGLLSAKSHLDGKVVIDGNKIFQEFKGSLTENYVLQELISNSVVDNIEDLDIYYWTNEDSTSEIDFIMDYQGNACPIEVKAETNLKAKSLKYYVEKYQTKNNIRTSMSPYKKEEWLNNIPLYAIGCLKEYLKKGSE